MFPRQRLHHLFIQNAIEQSQVYHHSTGIDRSGDRNGTLIIVTVSRRLGQRPEDLTILGVGPIRPVVPVGGPEVDRSGQRCRHQSENEYPSPAWSQELEVHSSRLPAGITALELPGVPGSSIGSWVNVVG